MLSLLLVNARALLKLGVQLSGAAVVWPPPTLVRWLSVLD